MFSVLWIEFDREKEKDKLIRVFANEPEDIKQLVSQHSSSLAEEGSESSSWTLQDARLVESMILCMSSCIH